MPRKRWGSRLSLTPDFLSIVLTAHKILLIKFCTLWRNMLGGISCREESWCEWGTLSGGGWTPIRAGSLCLQRNREERGETKKEKNQLWGVWEERRWCETASLVVEWGPVGAYQRAGLSRWGLWAPSYHTRQPPFHQTNTQTTKHRIQTI